MWYKKKYQELICWNTTKKYKRTYSFANDRKEYLDILNNNKKATNEGTEALFYSIANKYKSKGELPSGVYKRVEIKYVEYLSEMELREDLEILDLKISSFIEEDFSKFRKSEKIYRDLGVLYRRGLLVYGPPGTGKTSIIHKVVKQLKADDVIIIFTNDCLDLSNIKALRNDKRLKVLIFEEFTNVLRQNGELTAELLDFLDGESSLDNCFIIASTNYPDRLPLNAVNRPGRFDKLYKIDVLSKDDVKTYLDYFNVENDNEVLNLCTGKTIAEVKEIILLSKRDEISIKDAAKVLEKQKNLAKTAFTERGKIGFGGDDE